MPRLSTVAITLALVFSRLWPSGAEPGRIDVPDTVLIPPILFGLHSLEEDDPDDTIFKVDRASFTIPSFSGNLTQIAKYETVSGGVYLRNLFFLKSFPSGILTLEADTAGTDSRRLVANYQDPDTIEAKISDTRVLHRLQHDDNGVNIDFNPNDSYVLAWERIRGDVNVGLTKGDAKVSLVTSFETQTRTGDQQHTFFQLHRFNCTDCHTYSASQGISQTTTSYTLGMQASLPNRTYLYGGFGGSTFSDGNSLLQFDFGGPFSNAVTTQTPSKDATSNFVAYTGNENYRVGASLYQLNRTNTGTGQTYNAGYFSANGLYQPMDQLLFTFGSSSQNQSDTLSANLSTARSSLYLEASGFPTRWLTARLRLGEDDTNYSLGAGPILGTAVNVFNHDQYWDLRVEARPDRELRLGFHFRDDNCNQPFFSIDPARRDLLEAWLTWSPSPLVMGINYRSQGASNNNYGSTEETTSAYVNALIANKISLYSTYSFTNLAQNSMGPVYIQDALGLPQQLQIGFPYTARLSMFSVGADVPLFGDFHARPYYRQMDSSSAGNFLPGASVNFADDTRLSLSETAYGVHFDIPAWKNTSLGVGWELEDWVDLLRSANNGRVNYFTLDFRTRF